jgi:hypothetical protein
MRRVSLNPLISLLIFIALFAGLQGGRYVFANRLQEVGTLCALIVFAIGAWITLFRLPGKEWNRWVFNPALLIFGVMAISGLAFALNFGGNALYNFFAAREFLLGFIGPAIVLIVRAGYPLQSLHNVILACLVALMVNYLYHYNTMDLRAAFFSSDHTISNLVTYDEWRGFRLKPSMVAVMLAVLVGFMMLLRRRSMASLLLAFTLIGLGAYIWSIVMFRSTLATMVFGLIIYQLFLAGRNRVPLAFVVMPLGFIVAPIVIQIVLQHFAEADGGSLRLNSFRLALQSIPNHFFFGIGEDSAYGITYGDLFGKKFSPSDIGLVGIAFKYGVLGLGLYLSMHAMIFVSLWRANLAVRSATGQHDPILFALLVLITAQTLNLPLIAGLGYAQGITTGSLSLAYASLLNRGVEPGGRDVSQIAKNAQLPT